MKSSSKQIIYGILAFLGLFVTWYYNHQYLSIDGNTLRTYMSDNKLNAASASVWYDVIIVYIASVFFFYFESKRIGVTFWWLYWILSTTVAIAFGLPLYLLMRERHLSKQLDN